MPSNIEIKAKLEAGLEYAERVAISLSNNGKIHQYLHQVDTFFFVPNGRMKLRSEGNRSVLITYFRSDDAGPKQSKYTLCPVEDKEKMLEALGGALGVKGVVEKDRKVYLVTWDKEPFLTARVHLDAVKNLGNYLEFEVMLLDDSEEQTTQGQLFANELLEKFSIRKEDLVEGAYLDCLTF